MGKTRDVINQIVIVMDGHFSSFWSFEFSFSQTFREL